MKILLIKVKNNGRKFVTSDRIGNYIKMPGTRQRKRQEKETVVSVQNGQRRSRSRSRSVAMENVNSNHSAEVSDEEINKSG